MTYGLAQIWSGEHGLWWRDDASGYTAERRDAGVYTWDEAVSFARGVGPEKQLSAVRFDGPMVRRVRLHRTKGWRLPSNTLSVARPTRWGNPFTVSVAIESGYTDAAGAQAFVVDCFRDWIGASQSGRDWWAGPESDRRRVFVEDIGALRDKNLACWCRLGQRCHADVLLELANRPARSAT